MTRSGLAQVVYSLTDRQFGAYFGNDYWVDFAEPVVALGGNWPAAVELAGMTEEESMPAIDRAVQDLHEQTGRDMDEPPLLGFWGTAAGIVARSCRFGLRDWQTAPVYFDRLWRLIRYHQPHGYEPRDRAEWLIECGWACFYADNEGGVDIEDRSVAVLTEADRFIPEGAVDAALCALVIDSFL